MTYDIDPELAVILPLLPPLDLSDLAAARAGLRNLVSTLPPPDLSGLLVTDVVAPGLEGPDVAVRVFRPEGSRTPSAGLLHIHGGGFVVGDVELEAAEAAILARELGIVVASVEYRLAPEHPYPAGLNDCLAALRWLHARADQFGFDPARVGVFGQSAGGGLAAAVALRARDEAGPALCFQFLGIPELDDRLDTPSMRRFVDTPMWNRPAAILSWQYYLRGLDGVTPSYAAPARAEDLSGLPPAYITAMEFDPLRDEAVDYAARLLQAGVSVELHVFPGTFHGSSLIPTATVSRRAHVEMLDVVRRGLLLPAAVPSAGAGA